MYWRSCGQEKYKQTYKLEMKHMKRFFLIFFSHFIEPFFPSFTQQWLKIDKIWAFVKFSDTIQTFGEIYRSKKKLSITI
jgi:hypothetical protein